MINIDVTTFKDLEYWLRTERTRMFTEMVDEIEYCRESGDNTAKIMRATLENGTNIRVDLTDTDWLFALNKCLEYFESVEMYEMCSKIVKLQNEINAG